jgi:hypothetical protein
MKNINEAAYQSFVSLQCKTIRHHPSLMRNSTETASDESPDHPEPESMQLELICGGCITCFRVSSNASLRTVLRQTRYAAYDSHLLLVQIGGKFISIDQLLAETVSQNKASIQLYIYTQWKCGTRESAESLFLQAPSVASQAQTQRTPRYQPAAVETTEDTAMDDRSEQAGGMRPNRWDFFFSAHEPQRERQGTHEPQRERQSTHEPPEQPSVASQAQTQRTPSYQPAAVETTEDTAMDDSSEQAGGMRPNRWDFFFSAHEPQRERQGTHEPQRERQSTHEPQRERQSKPSQELIAEFLGMVPRNKKEQKAKTKAGKQGKTTQKPKQKAKPKVFKWKPRLMFKDGINLLSTGTNTPVLKLGTWLDLTLCI